MLREQRMAADVLGRDETTEMRRRALLRPYFECAECQVAIVGKHVVAVWMVLCFLAGVAYCAYRRTQLREKFGIAGAPHLLHGALPVSLSLSCCRHALCLLVRGPITPCCLQQSLLVCLFTAYCRHTLCLLVPP